MVAASAPAVAAAPLVTSTVAIRGGADGAAGSVGHTSGARKEADLRP